MKLAIQSALANLAAELDDITRKGGEVAEKTAERTLDQLRASYPDLELAAVYASIHNHVDHQRHLNRRDIFKQDRAAALAEWRQRAT